MLARVRGRVRKFTKNTLRRIIGFLFDSYHSAGASPRYFPPAAMPLPQQYFLSLDSVPFSARIRRKAIKSRPTAVDSPQILQLAIKTDLVLYSSILPLLSLQLLVYAAPLDFSEMSRNQAWAEKESDVERIGGCSKRPDRLNPSSLSSRVYSVILQNI